MTRHSVVIAGAGPTGLMLAGELALGGADVAVVERRTGHGLDGSRGGGMTSRTLEVLDQRGIVDRFIAQGWVGHVGHFSQIFLDVSDLLTRHNYGLALPQYRIEATLDDWVSELGVPIYRGREVTGFTQDNTGVDVDLSEGPPLRAGYLVGCDGGRSVIRKRAGIEFAGWDPSTSCLVADVLIGDEPPWGLHRDGGGFHSFFKLEDGGPVRVMVTEPHVGETREPTLRDISERIIAVRGTDYGMHSAAWVSRFTDVTRQAVSYRDKRVLLAGDAAHVHMPIGGHGLNTGVQDAVNLGWKLAQVVTGTSPPSLLDTYHAERHPVGSAVLQNTMAQTALIGPGERTGALRDTVADLLNMDEPRQRIAATMCGLDIHYDLGEGHPLLGRRIPDLNLHTPDGPTRLFTLLHQARGILLNFSQPWDFDIAPWSHRVSALDARHTECWKLPVLGAVSAPDAVLVRPDGYVAWVGDGTPAALTQALNRWFA
ncbi:MAG: FAD-dependent monooxygenase [Mycobacteriaceae bacterium]|nr:FAD-dependent monooxygenase [Mycobacteriaceae bacterium]MBV9638708.1 FAD-dependent monooxygenase [Mycobacteriaceae bacterium]